MLNEPQWITPDELIELNQIVVAATGEPHLLRDLGLLESAAAVPRNRWAYAEDGDLVVLACALLFAVALNHPFDQGNKRTAFVAADVMLKANGFALDLQDEVEIADLIVAVIEHAVDEAAFAARLRPHVVVRG